MKTLRMSENKVVGYGTRFIGRLSHLYELFASISDDVYAAKIGMNGWAAVALARQLRRLNIFWIGLFDQSDECLRQVQEALPEEAELL